MYIFIGFTAVMSLIGFILYGVDKRKAIKQEYRISEKTLFLFALVFGGLGCLLGMYLFHHKTRHWYFVLINWIGVLFQAASIYFAIIYL